MINKVLNTTKHRPPFHYDIVGSFLRSSEIKKARLDFQNNKITANQLEAIENIEIKKLVEKEQEIGLKIVTDGEFRRSWWHLDFFLGIKGTQKINLNNDMNLKISNLTIAPGVCFVIKIIGKTDKMKVQI